MRNFFRTAMLSIAMLTLTLSSQAQVITAEQAQEIAEAFFAQGFKQTRSVAPALQKAWDSSVLTGSMQTRSVASDDPTFHAFTGSDGKGFVIVAGQETGTQIIGYSMDGTLPTDGNLPEGMTDYLTDIDNQIRAVRASGTTYTMTRAAATPAQYGTPVVELNTYPLAQGAPYNSVCNEILGRTVVTGCVPTAFAMVMLHHKWPNTITKRIGYSADGLTVQYINVADVAYDWANTFDSNGTLTTEGNNQVANMMFHLGAAYGVTWGSGSTDGSPNAYTMSNYFGYNYTNYSSGSSGMTNRGTAGDENWVTYIKQSLDAGYPIPYQATNSGSGSDAKHIFILDGYTDNNYYHFNWGWGGSCNGYYTLSNMAPTSSDEYAGGGIANHNAVFMLRPNRGNVAVTATASPDAGGTATVNGEASATIADGTQITLVATPNSGYTFLNWTLNGNVVSTSATYTPYLNGASDYVANFAASSNVCTVTVASNGNGSVSIDGADGTTYTVAKGTEVTVRATPNSGYSFSNWEYGTNSSTEATHTFTVTTDVTVTATFIPNVTVTVSKEGTGIVSIDGTSGTSYEVAQGTSVTVRATEAGVYEFEGWYNGVLKVSSDAVYTFIANSNVDIVAKFISTSGTNEIVEYEISPATGLFYNKNGAQIIAGWATRFVYTVNNNKNAEVVVAATNTSNGVSAANINLGEYALYTGSTGSCTYTITVPSPYLIDSYSFNYVENANVTITSNDVSSTNLLSDGLFRVTGLNSNSASFVLNASGDQGISISNFVINVIEPSSGEGGGETPEPTQYTVSATGDTNGSFTINGDAVTSVTVDADTEVILVATPNSGYEFAGWYDGTTLVHPNATYSFTVSADVNLTATYRASVVQYTVSAVAGNGGSVTINSNAVTSVTVDEGTEVTLVATPNDGYEFTGWYLGTAPTPESTNANYVVTANSNLSYVAQFAESAGEGGGEGGEGEGVKYYRIKSTSQSKYLHIESYNGNNTAGTKGGVGLAAYAEDDEDQIFSIEDAGNNLVYLVSKNGYYIVCRSYNVDACNDGQKSTLTMDYISETEFRLMNGTYYFKVGEVDGQAGSYYPYCDAAIGLAETWVLEEIAADEPDPTPDPAGISVLSYSQTLDDSNDENYIDGILIEFSQDIEVDWGVTEGTGTGGTGDTGGGTSYLRVRGTGDVSDVNNTIWTSNATIENGNTLRLPLENGTVINRTGEYTLTFPAGIITAADGSEYAGETFTFTVDAPPVKTSKSYSDFVNQFETIDVDFYDAIELLPGSDVTQISVYVYNTSTLAGTITVASGVTINNKTLTLTMDEPLAPAMSGKYSISIPDNLIARAGKTEKIYGGTTIDIYIRVPVTITDITPATGSEVEELESIAVTYSYSVSANGSNVNNVKLVNSSDLSEIALAGSVSGNVLTLTPSATVPAGTYTLKNLANAVYDNVDNYLVASVPDYTITVEEQLAPLTVVGVTPTESVNELQTITVEFSDAIAGEYDEYSMLTPIYVGNNSNGASYSVSGNVLTITLHSAITTAGTYALYIPEGHITRVADGSAVTMSGEYTFTVVEALAPLTVVGVTPTESVNELQTITVEFSDAIAGEYDEYSMLTPIYVGNNSNGASYSVSGNVLTITLHSAITTAGTYALYIPEGHITRVADSSPVTMNGEYTFTVVEAVEPEPGVETTDYIIATGTGATGVLSRTDGATNSSWMNLFTYTTTVANPAELKLYVVNNNMTTYNGGIVIARGQNVASCTYMLTVPAPYKIKSYSFDVQSALNSNTITAVNGTGNPITTNTAGTTHFSVTDVNSKMAQFTVSSASNSADYNKNQNCTNFVVQVYVDDENILDNGNAIYNMISGNSGWIIYNSTNADLLSSSKKYGTFATGASETTCQWAIYQSPNTDKYYIYSVAASKFVGQQTAGGGTVPLVAAPTNDIQIYNSTVDGYPFIFSTDNSGALNHNNGNQFATGLLNWAAGANSGGLISLGDAGSAHRLDYVSEIPDDMLETIRVAVSKYEGYSSLTDEQRAAAKALVDGWGGVGYPVASAIEDYLAAVDAANHAEDITAAQATLVASEIQMPEDGKAYTFTNVQKGGSEFVMGYNASNQMAFKDVETTAEFICRDLGDGKYAFVDNNGHYLAYKCRANNNVSNKYEEGYTDSYVETWTDLTITPMQNGGNVSAGSQLNVMGFVVMRGNRVKTVNSAETIESNVYFVIKNTGDYDGAGSAFYNDTYSSAFRMKEVSYANTPTLNSISGSTLIMNFEQEAMATFSAPFPTVLPEGVTAFYAKRDDCNSEVISLTAYEGDALPANQGFILAGDAGTITMIPAAGEATDDISGQNVMGHSAGAAKQLTAYSGYILTGGSQGAGFYATAAGTLAMNKAYLALSGTDLTGMRSVVIRFPGLTDIDRVTVDGIDMDDAVIYDLSGRRVENPSRGIYIVNGKKVLIK